MPYSPPKYPTSIPTHATDADDLPPWYDDLTWWKAWQANSLRLELCALMDTLGPNPQGNFTSVASRLSTINSGFSSHLTDYISLTNGIIKYLSLSPAISLDDWDDANYHDPLSNPDRLNFPAGRFLLSGAFNYHIDLATPYCRSSFEINSNSYLLSVLYQPAELEDFEFITPFSFQFSLTSATYGRINFYPACDTLVVVPTHTRISILNLGK